MNNWLEELFGVKKPIIAMCHLQPLPGDPYYDKQGGMAKGSGLRQKRPSRFAERRRRCHHVFQ